jgi:hypothetical protein
MPRDKALKTAKGILHRTVCEDSLLSGGPRLPWSATRTSLFTFEAAEDRPDKA